MMYILNMIKEESIFQKLIYLQLGICLAELILYAYLFFYPAEFASLGLMNFSVTGLRPGITDTFFTVEYLLGVSLVYIVSLILLLLMKDGGRYLYAFYIVFLFLYILFSGDSVEEPIIETITNIETMAQGITLYLIFLTPLKKKFK